jgi:ubiquinone/menaquinone biosynthesis C-methylase UbiE
MNIRDFSGALYKNRFNVDDIRKKNIIWKIICKHFLQRYIHSEAVVLDIGTGFGEFINNIQCKEKYAVDTSENARHYINAGIKFIYRPGRDLSFLGNEVIDIVFISNFSEHLTSKQELVNSIEEIRRVLKKRGKLLILGPNIKYAYKAYWDFFDHNIPLSDKGMVEVLRVFGFAIREVIPQFLPYTTKSKLPKNAFAVWFYLKFPILWKIIGKQMFIVAEKC